MLGRLYNKILKDNPNHIINPSLKINTDLVIANLETTITDSTDKDPKTFNYKMDPSNIHLLKQLNIDIVSLANNHIYDFLEKGMRDTFYHLKKNNIKYTGAGYIDEAQKLVVVERKGIKIGFLSGADHYERWEATSNNVGIWLIRTEEPETWPTILNVVRKAKSKVDILIMSLHWGPNYRWHPSPNFRLLAKKLIDNGVNIVHGHSAHHVQPYEMYKNGVIFYSLGDFIDDYAISQEYRNDLGVMVDVTINGEGKIKEIDYTPTKIENFQVGYAEGKDSEFVKQKFLEYKVNRAI